MLAKLVIEDQDIIHVQTALRSLARTYHDRSGISPKATAKRLEKYADNIKNEPKIEPDFLQQMVGDQFKYMPVLRVNDVLTEIKHAKHMDTKTQAMRQAEMYASMLRRNLKDKW